MVTGYECRCCCCLLRFGCCARVGDDIVEMEVLGIAVVAVVVMDGGYYQITFARYWVVVGLCTVDIVAVVVAVEGNSMIVDEYSLTV